MKGFKNVGEKKFYVIHVEPGTDDRVKRELRKKVLIESMEHIVGRVYTPRIAEHGIHPKTGKPVIVNKKRYPGYLIVRAHPTADAIVLINSIRGVMGFLPHKDRSLLTKDELKEIQENGDVFMPTALEDEEAALAVLRSRKLKTSEVYEEPKLKWGDDVTIVAGTYRNVAGKIISVNKDSYDVEFHILGTKTKVTCGLWQLRKKVS